MYAYDLINNTKYQFIKLVDNQTLPIDSNNPLTVTTPRVTICENKILQSSYESFIIVNQNADRAGCSIINSTDSVLFLYFGNVQCSSVNFSISLNPTDVLNLGQGDYNGTITGSALGNGTIKVMEYLWR